MTLYEITGQAAQLYDLLQSDEIDEQTVADTLEAMGTGVKLEDCCKVIRQLQADSEAYKAEADNFSQKQKTAQNAVDRIKQSILNYMSVTGDEKIKCGLFTVRVGHSKAVSIENDGLIPNQYKIAQPDKIDKMGIKKAILAGEEIPGASITENSNLQIK